jgi:exopolysaccharide biosynthesis protein
MADGRLPTALREPGAIDLDHRDARLAIGLDRDGKLLVVLTRLDVAIPGLDRVHFGLTVPEMAAVMGAFGARQAMLLDGGISAQLALQTATGERRAWPGIRKVPLALVGRVD